VKEQVQRLLSFPGAPGANDKTNECDESAFLRFYKRKNAKQTHRMTEFLMLILCPIFVEINSLEQLEVSNFVVVLAFLQVQWFSICQVFYL
jgi:hypothetical protein